MIRTKAQSMQDQPNRMFDLWLKDQIELIQLDDSTFSGPVVESLILLIAMMGVAWQCQRKWVQSH